MPSLYELLCVHGQGYSCVVAVSGVPDMESGDKAGRDIPRLPAKLLRIRLGRVKMYCFVITNW